MQQGSKIWHEYRKSKVGGSDAPVLMGVSPWKTILDLYNEKTSCLEIPDKSTFATRRGLELESLALSKFEQETGFLMTPRVLVHKTIPWMSASLDGMEIEGKCIVEIKCPGKIDHGLALKGIVPEKYFPQLQHQMEVAGLTDMYYMSYVSDYDFTIFKVQKDEDYTKKLLGVEAEFWNKVTNRISPELTDKDVLEIDNDDWRMWGENYRLIKSEVESLQEKLEFTKKNLIFLANNRSAKGCGIKLTKTTRKGQVDYSKVIELVGIDLEAYRKPNYESWMVTIKEENE